MIDKVVRILDHSNPDEVRIVADMLEESGRMGEAHAYRWMADHLMPLPCRWKDHVTVLEPTDEEAAYIRQNSGWGEVLAFSSELSEAQRQMRQIGNCNLWHMGVQERNQLLTNRSEDSPYTVDEWRLNVSRWSLEHVRKDRWLTAEALVAHRNCCRYLGLDAAAEKIDEVVWEAARREGDKRVLDEAAALLKKAEEEDLVREILRKMNGEELWTPDRAAESTGYDARTAAKLFHDGVRLVVVSGKAPTKAGWKIVKQSPVLYYLKASAGRWGRSVKKTFVLPK